MRAPMVRHAGHAGAAGRAGGSGAGVSGVPWGNLSGPDRARERWRMVQVAGSGSDVRLDPDLLDHLGAPGDPTDILSCWTATTEDYVPLRLIELPGGLVVARADDPSGASAFGLRWADLASVTQDERAWMLLLTPADGSAGAAAVRLAGGAAPGGGTHREPLCGGVGAHRPSDGRSRAPDQSGWQRDPVAGDGRRRALAIPALGTGSGTDRGAWLGARGPWSPFAAGPDRAAARHRRVTAGRPHRCGPAPSGADPALTAGPVTAGE